MVPNRPQWLVSDSCMCQKLAVRNAIEARSCDMYLLHSYVLLQLLKLLQAPFNPFSDSCLSKIRMKIWDEEPYTGEPYAVTTKFRNKLISFYYLKKAIAQNYEREINLSQRAYILT